MCHFSSEPWPLFALIVSYAIFRKCQTKRVFFHVWRACPEYAHKGMKCFLFLTVYICLFFDRNSKCASTVKSFDVWSLNILSAPRPHTDCIQYQVFFCNSLELFTRRSVSIFLFFHYCSNFSGTRPKWFFHRDLYRNIPDSNQRLNENETQSKSRPLQSGHGADNCLVFVSAFDTFMPFLLRSTTKHDIYEWHSTPSND